MSNELNPGEILHYHNMESAGHFAVRSFPSAVETENVQQVLQRMRRTSYAACDLLLVLDRSENYRGASNSPDC